jgi:hypothetical protein
MLTWFKRSNIALSVLRKGDEKGGVEAFKVFS